MTLNPEVTDRETVLPTCAAAATVWGTPHPDPLPSRGEGKKENSRRSEDLPGKPAGRSNGKGQKRAGHRIWTWTRSRILVNLLRPRITPCRSPMIFRRNRAPILCACLHNSPNDDYVAKIPDETDHSPLLPGGEGSGEGADEGFFPNQVNRVRGEISHRLLDTLARGEALPEPAAVRAGRCKRWSAPRQAPCAWPQKFWRKSGPARPTRFWGRSCPRTCRWPGANGWWRPGTMGTYPLPGPN